MCPLQVIEDKQSIVTAIANLQYLFSRVCPHDIDANGLGTEPRAELYAVTPACILDDIYTITLVEDITIISASPFQGVISATTVK
ncbi:hypothetical protein D3C84_993590 [compost metagenome]